MDEGYTRQVPVDVLAMFLASTESLRNEEEAEHKALALQHARSGAFDAVERFEARGFFPHPALRAELVERMAGWGRGDDAVGRVAYYAAWRRDVTAMLRSYMTWKHEYHGEHSNVVVECRGPTGSGKSSMGLSVAEWLGLRVEAVSQSIHFYKRPFLNSLNAAYTAYVERGKLPYEVVMLDEDDEATGEGSRTQEALVKKQEGRLRWSGISMIFCRPQRGVPIHREVTLDCYGVSYREKAVLALWYLHGQPLGYVVVPFCSPLVWAAYEPMKAQGVEHAARLANVDAALLRGHVLDILLDDHAMRRMALFRFDEKYIRSEIGDEFGAAYTSNEVQRMVSLLSAIGIYWGPDGDLDEFAKRVWTLYSKGVLPEPGDQERLEFYTVHARTVLEEGSGN